MRTLDQWLNAFLAVRGLDAPDGRPLYAYRCDPAEFEELQGHVAASSISDEWSPRSFGPLTSQAFCLWTAEWWRRNHEGGTWRWEDMLTAIGAEHLTPGNAGYNRLCEGVGTGLRAWKRPILRSANGREFLVTLACEGGLPLRLVTREQTGLRRYFKALLEEMRALGSASVPVEQTAERMGSYLPKSLRHEVVYTLCGRLAARVWQLQAMLGPTTSPVQDLDRLRPDWRDELPLRVDDRIAAALLNNLLTDAAVIARRTSGRIRWVRSLTRTGDAWSLEGELELPASLQPREFVAMFEPADGEAPRRFDLCLRSTGTSVAVVALGTTTGTDDSRVLRLEPASATGRPVEGVTVAAGRQLIARDGLHQYVSDQFSGASALSELPWVFDCNDDTTSGRWIGEGSVSVRAGAALIAAPEGAGVIPAEGADLQELGVMAETGRRVYRLAGMAACHLADGGLALVRTGERGGNLNVEYWLRGPQRLVGRGMESVFVGMPRLVEQRDDSAPVTVPAHRLQWRTDAPAARWVPLSAACRGDGSIRYLTDGQVRFVARVKLLPEGAEVRYHPDRDPSRGVIEITGAQASRIVEVRVEDRPSVRLRRLPGTGEDLHVELSSADAPPVDVSLFVVWADGQRLTLSLPFPSSGSGFETPDGRRLPSHAVVSRERLSGVRASALVPRHGGTFTLHAHYVGNDAEAIGARRIWLRVPLQEVAHGQFELDLGVVQSWVSTRLDASTDENGYVRLAIQSNTERGVPTAVLDVARFDVSLVLHPNDHAVRLPAESLVRLTPEEVETFRVEAFPLRRPDAPPVVLERYSNVTWLLPETPTESGPWMVVGWQGDWCRAKPCLWAPDGGEDPDESPGADPNGESDFLDAPIAEIAENPGHPAWAVVEGLLDWTQHLPPVVLPRLRRLANNPSAMAMAALCVSDPRFERLWTEMESLPFAWQLVPRTAWEAAVERLVRRLRADFAAVGDALPGMDVSQMIREHLDRRITRLTDRLRCLEPMLSWTRARLLGLPLTGRDNLVLNEGIRAHLLRERHQLLEQSGVVTGDLYGIPVLDEIDRLCAALPGILELDGLWVKKGLQPTDQRFSIANAPLIAALAALGNVQISRLQLCQLRAIRERARDWFDDSYDVCYLHALGTLKAVRNADTIRSAKPVLPLTH